MAERRQVTEELARLIKLLAHRHRIRIVKELREHEHCVGSLSEILGVSSSRVSQHLSLLRAHHVVQERRDGRKHVYSLTQPHLADWLLDGLRFLEKDAQMSAELGAAVEKIRAQWSVAEPSAQTG